MAPLLIRLASGLVSANLSDLGRRAARAALMGAVALVVVLVSLACLAAAGVLALAPHTGGWQAALIVGFGLALVALTLTLAARANIRARVRQSREAPVAFVLAALAAGLMVGRR